MILRRPKSTKLEKKGKQKNAGRDSTRATEIEHINCIREIREKHEMRKEDRPNW
jgi:hypothetical protein